MLHLWVAINVGVRQGRHPVSQDCRVAPLHQDPQSPPEVPDCLTLLLASVTGQGSPQLPHLPLNPQLPHLPLNPFLDELGDELNAANWCSQEFDA